MLYLVSGVNHKILSPQQQEQTRVETGFGELLAEPHDGA